MPSNSSVWPDWDESVCQQELDISVRTLGELFRNPDDPFEAWDEFGRPCLPMTIGDGFPSSGNGGVPSGVDLHSGRMSAALLAPQLHWQTALGSTHQVTWLSYRGRPVPIDINIASVVDAMWAAGFVTLACCEGDDTAAETGYVMFSEEIGKRFMEWAQVREEHLSQGLMRHFDILLQDDEWHPYMRDRYPLLQPVEPDADGRLFTLCWRFHRQDLLDHREQLVRLLHANPQLYNVSSCRITE